MKEGQDAIYYLAGASPAKSPLLEAFAKKGLEVLLFSDPLDELWLERTQKYKDKPLKSIARGEVGSDEEKKQVEEKQRELGDLLACLRVHLQDEIKEVRLSARLTTSPACLVGGENDPSPRILRMLEQMGQKPPQVKRILELNPDHELVKKLETIFAANKADPRLELYAKLLLGQAHLADSGVVPDPAAFSRLLTDVMVL
jgi:molecular chaperone HtpG